MQQELQELENMFIDKITKIKKKYGHIGKYKRKSIPKSVKDKVWNTYVGKEKGVGECYCCKSKIDSKIFDCGHIVAAVLGGENVVENLRPVCGTCNRSMGVQNMEEFKNTYFRKKRKRCCFF